MKQYMPYSNKKIDMVCPDCGQHKKLSPSTLLGNGLGCTCSDGQTYPNKFVYSLLNQLKIEYIHEYSPDWIKPKRYDIYIPSLSCIIENHGVQHYIECTFTQRTLEEEQANDAYKKDIAIQNGIQKYIVIDCRESEAEYIRESIIKSELSCLLSLNNIDWDQCNSFATSNMIKEAAKLWEDGLRTKEIAKQLHVAKGTICKYLKRAQKLKWCTYATQESRRRGSDANSGDNNKNSLLTVQLSLDNKLINIWAAGSVAKRKLNIQNICACCQGIRSQAGGYNWKYLYDHTKKDGTTIPGAITLGFITEEEALKQLEEEKSQKEKTNMKFYIRKSFNTGPFRTTISNKGISNSVGTNGIRIKHRTSFKTKNSKKIKNVNQQCDATIDSKEVIQTGWKMLAWICRLLFIPMIILGLLLCIIKLSVGIILIIIGVVEYFYSHKYFNKIKKLK